VGQKVEDRIRSLEARVSRNEIDTFNLNERMGTLIHIPKRKDVFFMLKHGCLFLKSCCLCRLDNKSIQ